MDPIECYGGSFGERLWIASLYLGAASGVIGRDAIRHGAITVELVGRRVFLKIHRRRLPKSFIHSFLI